MVYTVLVNPVGVFKVSFSFQKINLNIVYKNSYKICSYTFTRCLLELHRPFLDVIRQNISSETLPNF